MPVPAINLVFATPRKLPRASSVAGKVVVVDLAFATDKGFERITLPFIQGLGPRLVAWVDHHDHAEHARFQDDPRFLLARKVQHSACPEMIDPELVQRVGPVDSIVCHTDFDGLASAAKWMTGGQEPYPGCDGDARAIDTRMGTPSPEAETIDRALRARPYDQGLFGVVVRHIAGGMREASLWQPINEAAEELRAIEESTRRLALGFARIDPGIAIVDISHRRTKVDKTLLLMLGQDRERISMVIDGDTVTLAARFDSGIDLLAQLGLSGGMPTRVSLTRAQLPVICKALRIKDSDIDPLLVPVSSKG